MIPKKNFTLELDAKNYIRIKFNKRGLDPALAELLPKYKSTGIRLSKKEHFNYDKEEIYKKEKEADLLNKLLIEKVEQILASFKVQEKAQEEVKDSFTVFYKSIVDETKNYSTRVKYQSCYNTFLKFLAYKNLKDVSYSQVDIKFIKDFDVYLCTVLNQYKRKNEPTTISKVLGITRQMVNLLQERGIYYFKIHPYLGVKLIETHGKKDRLNSDELNTLLNIDKSIKAHMKLDFEQGINRYAYFFNITRAKNCFILSLLMNGMRIHDFLMIKIKNFHWVENNLELHYQTSKKGYQMQIVVPTKAYKYMWAFVKRELEKVNFFEEEHIKEMADNYEQTEDGQIFRNLIEYMTKYESTKNRLLFSFREQDNDMFKDYRADLKEDDLEKRIHSITAQYNTYLKDLQDFANIKTNISSHVSRHSLAQLMAQSESNLSIFEIMAVLGHKKLSTTDNYIKAFKQTEVSHKVSNILDKL